MGLGKGPLGLEISFVVNGAGAGHEAVLLFRLEYKTSVICHTVLILETKKLQGETGRTS